MTHERKIKRRRIDLIFYFKKKHKLKKMSSSHRKIMELFVCKQTLRCSYGGRSLSMFECWPYLFEFYRINRIGSAQTNSAQLNTVQFSSMCFLYFYHMFSFNICLPFLTTLYLWRATERIRPIFARFNRMK